MCVGDEVALVSAQQVVDGGAVVVLREAIEHVPVGRDQHQEVAIFATLLGLNQDAGSVDAQVRRRERVGEHGLDQRMGERGELLVPSADCRLGQR